MHRNLPVTFANPLLRTSSCGAILCLLHCDAQLLDDYKDMVPQRQKSVQVLLFLFLAIMALSLKPVAVLADCRSVPFPDTSGLGPLPPLNSTLDTINQASIAGLRTLEFGTNFQRRSANLIGQNPLITASNDDVGSPGGLISGGAAAAGDSLGSKISVLVSAFGATGDERADNLNSDIEWDTTATALSLDYAVSDNIFIGGMLGASDVTGCSAPEQNFTTPGSVNVISNEVSGSFQTFSLYGIFENEKFYVDSIVSFGSGDFDFRRAQVVNGLRSPEGFTVLERVNEQIVADTTSGLLRTSIAGGIRRQLGRFQFSPYGRLAFAQINIDGYREELDLANSPGHPAPGSGGGFALRLRDQQIESLTTGFGSSITSVIGTSKAVISLRGDFEWVHEFNDTTASLLNSLAGFSQGTISNSALAQRFPDRVLDTDFFFLGGSAAAVLRNGFQLYANLRFLLGYEDVTETHFGLGARYEF